MRPSRNTLLLEALGLVLKERRQELGMTQEDVAGEADLDRPFVTLIEAARKQPTVSVFWKLAMALQLGPGEFASRVDQRYLKLVQMAQSSG
jgi:transcriptional regulator with XRE-family HTH domain